MCPLICPCPISEVNCLPTPLALVPLKYSVQGTFHWPTSNVNIDLEGLLQGSNGPTYSTVTRTHSESPIKQRELLWTWGQICPCQILVLKRVKVGAWMTHSLKPLTGGAWVAQLAERLTSVQVMISQSVSLSPASGSVLTAQSLEPVSDSVSPSLSAPPLFMLCLSLSQK